MISLWSSFFSSYQCFIFRTWKHSLGFLFYNSSKQNTDSHTAAPSQKQRLLKAHSCIPEAAESSLLCGHQSDRDDHFGHESMSMTSVWTWGVSKGKDVKRRSKKANKHLLIVCETMQATFQWKQARRHIPLSNWVPSHDPARSRNTVHIQKFPALLQLKWLYIFFVCHKSEL